MAPVRPYYSTGSLSAAHYDVVTAADTRLAGDIDLYAGLAPDGGSMLELGAGGGRVAFELAARGFHLVGVDLSPAMLDKAQARLAQAPAEIAGRLAFRRGDMTALDLKRAFDAVICPYFTLAHVPAGAAWRNTFAVAARHLQPGGLAAFHLPRLDLMRLPGPDPAAPVMDRPLGDGRRLVLFVKSRSFREDIGRLDQVVEYVELGPAGVLRRSAERLTYYLTDPEPLAATAGLVRDRDPAPLGDVGDIWVFRKA